MIKYEPKKLSKCPIKITPRINALMKSDRATAVYISNMLQLYFAGEWGEIDDEEIEANWGELTSGKGILIARYNKAEKLDNDIHIASFFDFEHYPDHNYNSTSIMYADEY